MFKAKLIIFVIAVLSFMIAGKSNSQEKDNAPSVTFTKNLSDDNDPVNKIFILYQNEKTKYPDVTNIKFSLRKGGKVILYVIDKSGRIIENLIDGEMQPCVYNVYFKSSDKLIPGKLSYKIQVDGISGDNAVLIIK